MLNRIAVDWSSSASAVGAERIAEIAAEPFAAERWWNEAKRVADALGDDARTVAVGTMVHVPPCRQNTMALEDWTFAVQVAAALVIARTESMWEGSARRETLAAIVDGPVDWTTTAALHAIAEIGLREPEHRDDCVELLGYAMDRRPMSPVVWSPEEAP